MDANKKVDLEQVQSWIYTAQFWHTLKEDESKYRLTFMLDKKVLSLTLDDFGTIFYLPQANDNNHDSFVPPPSFLDMVPFYKQQLGFTMELKTSSSFKTTGLLQSPTSPNATLCKIFPNAYKHGRHKDKVGMQIPDWMITEEMKHTEHYRMSPNPKMDEAKSSAPKRSTVIRFCLPERRSTHLTPPAPMPTVDKAYEMILQDTLQISLAEHKSREEQEARENVELVNKHLASEEIEKMMEGSKNVEITKDEEVVITNDKEVEITNVVIPVNFNKEEKEITDEVYELKRREKGKIIEESRSTPFPTPIRSPRIHTDLVSSNTEKLQELTVTDTTPSSRPPSTNLSKTN
ncbi:hypothetical protein Tco_0746084 [Tanacetum coccineum]